MDFSPNKHCLTCMRIRLCVLYFILLSGSAALYFIYAVLSVILISLFTCLFLIGFFVYLPRLYKSIRYQYRDLALHASFGVFLHSSICMKKEKIAVFSVIHLPLQKMFGLCTVLIQSAGGKITFLDITKENAKILKRGCGYE